MIRIIDTDRILFFNRNYIESNTIDNRILERAGITLYTNEIFVRYSEQFPNHFISPYGRVISYINGTVTEIALIENNKYMRFTLSYHSHKKMISINRAVADVFCPCFWSKNGLEAHHCDIDTYNNNLLNIVLLPIHLHHKIHEIKSIELLKDNQIVKITNPLELLILSNGVLTLEDIITPEKNKRRKAIKGKYGRTIYNVKGYQIAYKYHKSKSKSKGKTKSKKSK